MAKLRHIALVVHDVAKTARFYEKNFDMKKVFEAKGGVAVYLSDGIMNLAILDYKRVNTPGQPTADGVHGLHHFGFRVDDLAAAEDRVRANGGTYCYDFGDPDGMNFERKYRDPEGILFDISQKGWYGALDE